MSETSEIRIEEWRPAAVAALDQDFEPTTIMYKELPPART